MQTEFEPAYILHSRPYRDTSLLVNFFSLHYGRMSCVVRGVRKAKSSKRNLLNPFQRLLISFQGKTDLKLLTQFEPDQQSYRLEEKFLFSGFYVNEILMRLLPEQDAHEELFFAYEKCLELLAQKMPLEACLRKFELDLLRSLGYEISFEFEAVTHENLAADAYYSLEVNQGFIRCVNPSGEDSSIKKPSRPVFKGEQLLAIAQSDFAHPQVLVTAKQITRILLQPLLGDKALMSRELFSTH